MAELLSVCTVRPEHCVTAADTTRDLTAALPPHLAARFVHMVEASGNESRHLVHPLERLRRLDALDARNQEYAAHAVRLGEAAARAALRAADVDPQEVGTIIGVSSTGYLMPTLESHLIERLRLSPSCRRVPLTQLGCTGGAAGLGLAADLCAVATQAKGLVVSVELPSLSFPTTEPSPADIVATTQFGDAAAAAVLSAGRTGAGPAILARGSAIFPGTLDRNEALLTSHGLRLRPARGLTELLRARLGAEVGRWLAGHDLTRGDIAFWAIHPRSPELLEAAAASLELPAAAVEASRNVWRRNGNVISAAVFHVLRELAATAPPADGALGVVLAYGTGFSCEMLLVRAGGWLCGARRGTTRVPGVAEVMLATP